MANYACGLELPWFESDAWALTIPGEKNKVTGVAHLADTKGHHHLPIRHFPRGDARQLPP